MPDDDDEERTERDERAGDVAGDSDRDNEGDSEGDDADRDWRDDYLDDALESGDDDERASPAPPMSRFRHTSIGLTLGAAMSGLGNALEPSKKEDPPVIVEHDEDESRQRVALHLDPDNPADSVILFRAPRHDDAHHDDGHLDDDQNDSDNDTNERDTP